MEAAFSIDKKEEEEGFASWRPSTRAQGAQGMVSSFPGAKRPIMWRVNCSKMEGVVVDLNKTR